ncbi:MAG: nitrite reductase, copper-containing [Chloroflexi bacterium]|nr:nitrite reductase, copper-containing [Chloroflexota bacterium]
MGKTRNRVGVTAGVKTLLLGLGLAAVLSLSVACRTASTSGLRVPEVQETAQLLPPPNVPPPIIRDRTALVIVNLEATERVAELAPGVQYKFWGFNGTTPGPLIRVRQGDVVQINLTNPRGNALPHNIDLHAVNGPGGGAAVTNAVPGETKSFEFRALAPGAYVYHCAMSPVPLHIGNGMYGLIVVEPEGGLPKVDREFYVMQGDFYPAGDQGVRELSLDKLLSERPEYVVFNGSTTSLVGDSALQANVGERVRLFFGVGGPNLVSSFHVIGEIFDKVYPESASEPASNIQTTLVPAGGATMVEFTLDTAGTYLLVDHSIGRVLKGAAGQLVAKGEEKAEVFRPLR